MTPMNLLFCLGHNRTAGPVQAVVAPLLLAGLLPAGLLPTLVACGRAAPRTLVVERIPGVGELRLIRRQELVEVAWQDVYDLEFTPTGGRAAVRLTGNVATLPEAARYRRRLRVEDVRGRTRGGGMGLFGIHWVSPERITDEQFTAVVKALRGRAWPEGLTRRLDTLVRGDHDASHEVFSCADGLFLYTDSSGHLWITDDARRHQLTVPAKKRHFNFHGSFDDEDRLTLRRGRVLSDAPRPDLHGRPSLPVAFATDGHRPADEALVDVRWAKKLYPADTPGVDAAFLRACRGGDGRRLDEAFHIKEREHVNL